jgi:hypothetical protein
MGRQKRATAEPAVALRAGRARSRGKLAELGEQREPPVTWIVVLLLVLGAFAAAGLRIDARRRDKPAELSLAQRWKAMGGG